MFCVKLWDVESAAAQIAPLVANGGVVDPVPERHRRARDPAARARRRAGRRRRRVHRRDDSRRRASSRTPARWRGCASARSTAATRTRPSRFAMACAAPASTSSCRADIRRALWEKFCFLSALSGTHLRWRASRSASCAPIPTCARRSRRPCARRGRSAARAGVALADDFVAKQLACARCAARRDALVDAERPRRRPPARGAVAVRRRRRAWRRAAGVAAPVSATLYAALKPYVDGARPDARPKERTRMRLFLHWLINAAGAARAAVHLHVDHGRLVRAPR